MMPERNLQIAKKVGWKWAPISYQELRWQCRACSTVGVYEHHFVSTDGDIKLAAVGTEVQALKPRVTSRG